MFIVGIDVGGTFTDLTAVDEATGRVVVTKVPSRPRHEADAVLAGLAALGIAARDVRRLVHGTTVGTNAVLERRGARVAVLTTAGFRDLIEIGRTKRNIPALFVPTFVRPKPVVERKHRFEVVERLAADGRVLVRARSRQRRARARRRGGGGRRGARGVPAARLPESGARADDRRRRQGPVPGRAGLVLGRRGGRVPRVRALLDDRAQRVSAAADGRAISAASRSGCAPTGYAHGVLTVASSGGMMTTETARRLPIKTIFSGPAGGVSQACFVGGAAGVRDLITYDMGGTSTDVCLVRDLAPLATSDGMVGAFPVKVPQIDMHTVGAGGGSIAWLDVDGSLQVGPRQRRRHAGPGRLRPRRHRAHRHRRQRGARPHRRQRRLGGSIALDAARARAAVAEPRRSAWAARSRWTRWPRASCASRWRG